MAIAVGVNHRGYSAGSTAITTGSVTTTASGSTFVVFAQHITGSFTSITDSKSNTYSALGSGLLTFSGLDTRAYICENGTGGASHTWTLNKSASNYGALYAIEITGGATASIVDTVASSVVNNNGTNNPQPVTTTQAAELILAYCMSPIQAAQTITFDGSFTQVDQTTDGDTFTAAVVRRVVSSTGTYDPLFADGFAQNIPVITIGLKELVVAPTVRKMLLLGVG